MERYNIKSVEKKWQDFWSEKKTNAAKVNRNKRKCNIQQKCTIKKITTALEHELQVAILKKAVIFEEEQKTRNKKKRPELRN